MLFQTESIFNSIIFFIYIYFFFLEHGVCDLLRKEILL